MFVRSETHSKGGVSLNLNVSKNYTHTVKQLRPIHSSFRKDHEPFYRTEPECIRSPKRADTGLLRVHTDGRTKG